MAIAWSRISSKVIANPPLPLRRAEDGTVQRLVRDRMHILPSHIIMRQLLQETTMTTITLDIPDVLAERLAQRSEQLPQLLAMALELFSGEAPFSLSMSPPDHLVFTEMINFLASGPTPAQIVAFKLSPAAQARLETLLDTHREEGLTRSEERRVGKERV